MPRLWIALLAACLIVPATPAPVRSAGSDLRALEQMLLDVPSAQGALDDSAHLNEEAHYAGTTGDRDMAVWMRDQLRRYGFAAEIEPVRAQVPALRRAVLQLLVKPRVDFALREAPIAADPDGTRSDAGIPFNAGSGSGDVTAPLVYANQGLESDYATLQRAGVGVAHRIVLVRYGAQFRGELADRAAAHGAAGVIFYSDPAERDGSAHGAPYPDGPYRPLGSVQRGSLGTPRLKIPVLPVSAIAAGRLLQEVHGAAPPPGWQGGLGVTYAVGVSDANVRLRVDETMPWKTLWNTVGTLAGEDSTHDVILGGHRDAWVYGVTDNGSGISTLLETARALGYLYRSGWRPRYSIVIAGWDGEEIGEVGSTAFVQAHRDALARGCIAYVNADEVATGSFFHASGAAALANLVPAVTRLVPDPAARTRTMWERWSAQRGGAQIGAPGGGSDHEPFLYLLGIPTLEVGFYGPFGVYHSAYDDLRYAATQADPQFSNHRTLAQMLAVIALRMTSGPLPYRPADYVPPMLAALAVLRAQAAPLHVDLSPVAAAVQRFAAASTRGTSGNAMFDAVQRLDLLFYGRDGYRPIAFPTIANALANQDGTGAQRAVQLVAGTLDAITGTLTRAGRV